MELKYRCPYCGAMPQSMNIHSESPCFVECTRCKARGPEADTPEKAVELWDSRIMVVEARQKGEMMSKPGIVLGGAHIDKAVHDSAFFDAMPEFASIKSQLDTMHIDMHSKAGCSSCNKRRLHANIDGNFVAIASELPQERALALKKYLGIGDNQKLYIRALDPTNGRLVMKSF